MYADMEYDTYDAYLHKYYTYWYYVIFGSLFLYLSSAVDVVFTIHSCLSYC